MKRMHLKRKKLLFNSKFNIIILILFLVFICTILVIFIVGKRVNNELMGIGVSESKKFASIIITKSVSEDLIDDLDNLYKIEKNINGEIESIDIDSVIVNKILTLSSLKIQDNLKYLENGDIDKIDFKESLIINYDEKSLRKGIFYKVPIGIIFNNTFLSNLGPKIPIRFSIIGNLISNLNTKINSYGINNVLIESSIHYTLTLSILLPFYKTLSTFEVDIPVAIKIINGKVPEYYSNGYNESSPILKVPVE